MLTSKDEISHKAAVFLYCNLYQLLMYQLIYIMEWEFYMVSSMKQELKPWDQTYKTYSTQKENLNRAINRISSQW